MTVNDCFVGASPVKESRTSRKRRKRREVANKAADAEMAEIGLEQHMLELKMKQKLPLAAKKSVSPVRNTTTQGVWKVGSLLLWLLVFQEAVSYDSCLRCLKT